MKIKVNKHKLNIHYRGSPWGSRTQQHAYCLRYAHSHHIESHLGKKQPQAKIAIAFLFGQLHFNNVTSHALFYGGHLVMRSKRCAVQNQAITLIPSFNVFSGYFYVSFNFWLQFPLFQFNCFRDTAHSIKHSLKFEGKFRLLCLTWILHPQRYP